MLKIFLTILFFTIVFITFPGCTYRAWYEGFRETERQNCYKIENSTERLQCLDRVNNMSYEQYQKERKESQQQ